MGSVFQRGDSSFWWIAFYDASGRRRSVSTKSEDRAFAEKMLAAAERKVAAQKDAGLVDAGPLTVRRYAIDTWLAARRARGVASADADEDRLNHALPVLGDMKLEDVRRRHVQDLVHKLNARQLAPRTVLHVYSVLRLVFQEAVHAELIPGSPCTLSARRGELPKKRDKDPAWRVTAIFSRSEVEQLISDPRIPEYRRMIYGLLFLAGMRINEVTPRRWRDWDPKMKPLGKITVGSSYVLKTRTEKAATKTGVVREVPVHPTLAKMLAAWKVGGWQRYQARPPREDDLIVPSPTSGKHLNSASTLLRLHEDLKTLGFRQRRQHDARRTFVSLGIADGARKEVLRWVSHGPEGDVVDLYTTLPWETLCKEVAMLNVKLREKTGKAVPLAAGATPLLRHSEDTEIRAEKSGRRGTRTLSTARHDAPPKPTKREKSRGCNGQGAAGEHVGASDRSNVAADYESRAEKLGFRLVRGEG